MLWYYNFMVRRPYLMILGLTVLSLACIIVSLTMNALPDFSDPTMGFEARGTIIGKRLNAWHNLLQETEPSGILVADPNDLYIIPQNNHYKGSANAVEGELQLPPRKHKNRNRKNRNRKRKNKFHHHKHKNHNNNNKKKKINSLLVDAMTTTSNDTFLMHKNISTEPSYAKEIRETYNEKSEKSNLSRAIIISSTPSAYEWNGDSGVFRDYELTNDTWNSINEKHLTTNRSYAYGRNSTSVDEDDEREKIETKKNTWHLLKTASMPSVRSDEDNNHILLDDGGYFCDNPNTEYAHFVIERRNDKNSTETLFNLNGLLAMCQLQEKISSINSYRDYCQMDKNDVNCCRTWSLASYVTLLANKTSCFDLTADDISMAQNILNNCLTYFHYLKLSNDCIKNHCNAPVECTQNNAVYNIFHYLTDYNFMKINSSIVHLKYAMIFIPVVQSVKLLPVFHEWEQIELKNEAVQVIAMDLGLEYELFNELLLIDVWLVSLGGIFVMICVWLYTTSIFVTLMTCVAVIFCLGLAYFIYTIVFEMAFFPYMNLLAVVVIIGIGADNAFLFVKIWHCVLAERFTKTSTVTTQSLSTIETVEYTESLQNLMSLTLQHAAPSMIVSSLTTAGAFYASYVSSITSIKCFGVFAGTAVMTNAFLMVTWLPASVCIMERMSACKACSKLQVQKLLLMMNKSINRFCKLFETTIISLVMQFAHYWIGIFATIGVFSIVVVMYYPGLQLPENADFPLFVSQHPFEMYKSKLKNEFWFERSMMTYEKFKLPLRFVWGIQPIDDGDYSNPYAHGNLYFDNNFNISSKKAQLWLFDFCHAIKNETFYQRSSFEMLLPNNCFIEIFMTFMERMCIDSMDGTDRTPCCDISKFPFEPPVFELCLPQIISSLYATPMDYFIAGVAGPKFLKSNDGTLIKSQIDSSENTTDLNAKFTTPPLVKALVIEYESTMAFTASYSEVKQFVRTVENWFTMQLKSAPTELQGGWFISELKFFDLQDTLARGTIIAIIVAMSASSVVLLLVTLNVLVSLYAIITVTFTIFTTMAILILLGWRLNLLESITVSSAIGLAVDFSLHYGIHYRLSPTCERLAATQFSLSRIIGPTAMAALTTGFAGVFMLASEILPYIQIGIFLVVVMTVSWLYGTFFLMSLLKLAGPQYGFMQFNYPKILKKRRTTANGNKYFDRKINNIVASDQLLTPSNSGIADLMNSETHELESLNSGNLIKTISGSDSLHAHKSASASISPNSSRNYEHTTFQHLADCIKSKTPLNNAAAAAAPADARNNTK